MTGSNLYIYFCVCARERERERAGARFPGNVDPIMIVMIMIDPRWSNSIDQPMMIVILLMGVNHFYDLIDIVIGAHRFQPGI